MVGLKAEEVTILKQIAVAAGALIMPYYRGEKAKLTKLKADHSQVTEADLVANHYLIDQLTAHFPQFPILSEEKTLAENQQAVEAESFLVIDPLDGTSGFVKNSPYFTVNIALIHQAKPVFGVISAPAFNEVFFTDIDGQAYYQKMSAQAKLIKVSSQLSQLRAIATKRQPELSQVKALLAAKKLQIAEFLTISSSYKFCLIANGGAEIYPRKASIAAWDIAAGQALIEAAGGLMVDQQLTSLTYQLSNSNLLMPEFIALNNLSLLKN